MATIKTTKKKKLTKKPAEKKIAVSSGSALNVVGTDGKAAGKQAMPAKLFSVTVNKPLLAQAVRVYRANQREGSANTKTRGEVAGSTRKIYRQKGTGRARHGAIRAPIFVGGGIVFGPRSHSIRLHMSQKMRHAALAGALTQKKNGGHVVVVAGMDKLPPKTRAIAQMCESIGAQTPILLVVPKEAGNVPQAARNIPNLHIARATDIHTYDILSHKTIVFMKEAVGELIEA